MEICILKCLRAISDRLQDIFYELYECVFLKYVPLLRHFTYDRK
jgi:hypothetical protein